jgi:dTDP-glucose 4,6-dehydratase
VARSIVTGGAGFIGSHLVDALVKRGDEVIVLDNLSTGRLANLADGISSGRVSFVYADVAVNTPTMRVILDRADVVGTIDTIFHLASPASPQAYEANPGETLAVNSVGTMSLIDIALERGARLVYASTSEVYGDPGVHPQPEHYVGNVDPIGPRSQYVEAKRFGEAAIAAAVRSRGLDARVGRFFPCYGPRMQSADGRLIPTLLDAAVAGRPFPIQGSGSQMRSLTYVDDAVELLLLVAASGQADFAPINIGNDDERSVLDIAKALAAVLSANPTFEHVDGRDADPQRCWPDLSRARALGWSPRTSLERGLRSTYDWYAKESQIFV